MESPKDILEKAIQKAMDCGYSENDNYIIGLRGEKDDTTDKIFFTIDLDDRDECYGTIFDMTGVKDVIFNHDFAKALWGDKPYVEADTHVRVYADYAWQYHLQQMVIADDPLKYLGENL